MFFLGEGARWDESSIAGNSVLRTPHIDRIAREGVLFRNAFCINSLCLPARATILSGLYSHTSGAVDNQHSKVPKKFPIVTDLIRNGGPVGRRLDFLAQELAREANTLCSKANDVTLTAIGLDLRAQIEQWREQIQNIE